MLRLNRINPCIFIAGLLLCNDNWMYQVFGKWGGHDLFTSLAQLEVLWHNEIKVVGLMEKIIKKVDAVNGASSALKM